MSLLSVSMAFNWGQPRRFTQCRERARGVAHITQCIKCDFRYRGPAGEARRHIEAGSRRRDRKSQDTAGAASADEASSNDKRVIGTQGTPINTVFNIPTVYMASHFSCKECATAARLISGMALLTCCVANGLQLDTKNEYDKVIQETEAAYLKILESSQTLLTVLKRESVNIQKRRQAGT